jgi:hypothetical protein
MLSPSGHLEGEAMTDKQPFLWGATPRTPGARPVERRVYRVPIGFHGNWVPDAELEEQRKLFG